MPEIRGCTVQFDTGRSIGGCRVLFKDNGWVRVRRDDKKEWYPPQRIDRIWKQDSRGDG